MIEYFRLLDVLFDTWKSASQVCAHDQQTEAHKLSMELVVLIDNLTKLIAKDTPHWVNIASFLIGGNRIQKTKFLLRFSVLEDCGSVCADFDSWFHQDCASSCFNLVNVLTKVIETGKVPMMMTGKGTMMTKSLGSAKRYQGNSINYNP